MAGIVAALLVFGVTLNLNGSFPAFDQLPIWLEALILGFVSGLFMELGKFLVLDRLMPMIRSRESGLLFGLGWSGVSFIFLGLILAFGVFGMQNLATTTDINSVVPNADSDQIQFLQASQQQIQELAAGSPFKAFTPLMESTATIILDMGLVLLIILGFNKKQTRFTWFAVGIRTALSAALIYASQIDGFPIEIVFAGWILVGGLLIFYLQKTFKPMKAV